MMKRNQRNRLLTMVLSVVVAAALVAGEVPGTVDTALAKKTNKTGKRKKKIALNKKKVTLKIGKKVRLRLKGATGKIVWKSRNKSVATVNKKGIVRAKKKGKTVIIAKAQNKSYRCFVTVTSKTGVKADVDWEKAADKFAKLTEFITENGTDQEGTMVLQKVTVEEEEETAIAVSYNPADQAMIFEKISKSSEDDQTIVSMTIYADDLENASVDAELIDAGISYIGGTSIDGVAEYTGEDELEMDLAAEDSAVSEEISTTEEEEESEETDQDAEMNSFASDFFNEAIYEWDDYLTELGAGVSLKDIGFVSIEF